MISVDLKNHLLNMYLIAMSDSEFAESEMLMILDIIEKKGISKEEFERIIINPTNIPFAVPEDTVMKIEYLFDFARIIWADGIIVENEKIALTNYCVKFGFEGEAAEQLAEWLLELSKNSLSKDQLHEEITKLLNS